MESVADPGFRKAQIRAKIRSLPRFQDSYVGILEGVQ